MTTSSQPVSTDFTLGFIGGGHMASAIVTGLMLEGFAAERIWISEPSCEQRNALSSRFSGVHVTANNSELTDHCDAVVLAVKPQVMAAVCGALSLQDQESLPVVVSIAAGVRTDSIVGWLGARQPVVRAMPNQGAAARLSTTGLYANDSCSREQRNQAETIMRAVGSVVWVDEEIDIDAITAVAGSGPAYLYYLMEVMQQAAEQLGLSSTVARQLAVETAQAASVLAQSDDETLAALRARVTSPGGTTAAALEFMQANNFAGILTGAINEAHARAAQLADAAAKD
ncbi:MAG: pyrroline-5-carboxylate reductase [Pseudomonadota bacterium]